MNTKVSVCIAHYPQMINIMPMTTINITPRPARRCEYVLLLSDPVQQALNS